MLVEIKNVSKKYTNQFALKNVSFSLKKGEIIGFLGPNGAGKSTMMKIITGYVSATSGKVFVKNNKVDTRQKQTQQHIGYLPEHNPLYLEMYVKEYLQFNAMIHKIDSSNIESIIQQVGLSEESNKKIKQLSKGYRQRVGLAAALLHNPPILILDEPTTGLDPNQLSEIRTLIKSISKDKAILLSTHIMQEVEAICDRVIIINKGEIVADNYMKELQKNQRQAIEVEFDFKIESEFLMKIPHIKNAQNIYDTTWLLEFDTEIDMRTEVFDFAHKNGLKIVKMLLKNQNLETIFKQLTI